MELLALSLIVAIVGAGTVDPPYIDPIVAGVELGDSTSGKAFVMRYGGRGQEDADDFPLFQYANKAQTEILELLLHYGGGRYDFMQFRIRPLAGTAPGLSMRLSVSEFTTGKGVRLGMSILDLVKLLGEPHGRQEDGKSVRVTYWCSSRDQCPVLEKHNMPEYEAHYLFVGGVLAAFEGGYPYP